VESEVEEKEDEDNMEESIVIQKYECKQE